MTVMIVNRDELSAATRAALERTPHETLAALHRFMEPARLQQLALQHMFLTDPGEPPSRRSSLKTVCRPWFRPHPKGKAEHDWVRKERSQGARIVQFDPSRCGTFSATLDELIQDLAAIARIADSGHASPARAARKFLKGKSVIEAGSRSEMLERLENRLLRDVVKARMTERVIVPEPMMLQGLSFVAMDSPAAIDALGNEAGNCLRRRFADGDRFYKAADGLLKGTTQIWAVRSGNALVAVMEVDIEKARICEIKGPANATAPRFMAESLYDFMRRQNLCAAGADCGSIGVIPALLDRDRTAPDTVIWDRDKAYRVWIDTRHVVICGPGKHAVLRAPADVQKTTHGRIADALAPRTWTMSRDRSLQLLALLLGQEAGAHPVVRSIAAQALATLSTREHGRDGYEDPFDQIDED